MLHGCEIADLPLPFLTCFFIDDCSLYFRSNATEASFLKQNLIDYGIASGQRINFHKSSVSCSRNVSIDE